MNVRSRLVVNKEVISPRACIFGCEDLLTTAKSTLVPSSRRDLKMFWQYVLGHSRYAATFSNLILLVRVP